MQKLLNVKNTVIESYNFHNDVDGITHLRIKARPNAWHQDDWTFQESSLRLKRLPTELSARSMALLLLLFRGRSKAYGFRNIQNMMDMVYLVCSDIRIPLPNRKSNVQNMA